MDEYIKRQAVLDLINRKSYIFSEPPMSYEDDILLKLSLGYYRGVEKLPAADVVEVVHGEWIEEIIGSYIPAEWDENGNLIEHHYKRYRCSLCGRKEGEKEPYCNCGAKMNGERRAE